MKVTLIVVGKTDAEYLRTGIDEYTKRLKHYLPMEVVVLPDVKNAKSLSEEQQKKAEGQMILSQVATSDHVCLLDENGQEFTSRQFAETFERLSASGAMRVVFVIGGPYGFSEEVYGRANSKISLSRMTYSHQMVRLIFVEQLYRAQTIVRGEPYHHD